MMDYVKVYAGHPHGFVEVPPGFVRVEPDLTGAVGCEAQSRACEAELATRERALQAHKEWCSGVFGG